jgi:hypothetical protein
VSCHGVFPVGYKKFESVLITDCTSSVNSRYCFFFFFCGTGAWTQGLHLEPLHQPLLWCIFLR